MNEVNSNVERSTFGDLDVLSALKEQMEDKPVAAEAPVKKAPAKKASKTVLRKGTSTSRAQKQAAAKTKKLNQQRNADGSFNQQTAVDLILNSFN